MKDMELPPQMPLRPPGQVMRLARMGAFFPTRLSFLRVLTRRLSQDGARVTRPLWEIDAEGFGRAVYAVRFGGHDYALVCVTQPLADEARSDRVIATAWDAAFVLHDGLPDPADIDRIAAAAPLQEAGRFTARDLVLSRANKSVRLWSHVVERLREGRQPDADFVNRIGYLMRTTAVYGNGKFGIADRGLIADRPGLGLSFMAEMLTVWLIRQFTLDLVEHVGGARLDRALARHLGIGNATGLGMAPFLVSHPVLLNNWMMVRETALARARAVDEISDAQAARVLRLAQRAGQHLAQWQVPEAAHQARIDALRADWAWFQRDLPGALDRARPFDGLIRASEAQSLDLQELLVALVIEACPDLVDGLADCLTDPFGAPPPDFPDTRALGDAARAACSWALDYDFSRQDQTAQFWYVSEEKLEPRLGRRHEEPGADRESPLFVARAVQEMLADLPARPEPLGDFLARHPRHLWAVERVAVARACPYSEIRDNLLSGDCLPIDMLRSKLAMFGATRFDPKSDLWTRVTLAQGAPLAEDLGTERADDWWLPVLT
ncbi:MAG: hypothetical protein EP307_08725 [Rhodobacteraceae bacterium]|nr:MAG: hypothetical protein EP307_08725 [Paracoccaceae bacterium]